MARVLPVHVIYYAEVPNTPGYVEFDFYLKKMLREKIASPSASPDVILNLICAGTSAGALLGREDFERLLRSGPGMLKVDLKSALDCALKDCRDLRLKKGTLPPGPDILPSELVVFLSSHPLDGWELPLAQLKDEFNPTISAIWVSKEPKPEPASLKQVNDLLDKISTYSPPALSRIIHPQYATEKSFRAYVDDLWQRVERKIGGRPGGQPAGSIHGASASQTQAVPQRIIGPSPQLNLQSGGQKSAAPSPTSGRTVDPVAPLVTAVNNSGTQVTGAQTPTVSNQGRQVGSGSSEGGIVQSAVAAKPREAPKWEVREPPPELGDRVPPRYEDHRPENAWVSSEWKLVGASRRGRLHEHEATFREDAFQIEACGGWYLIAVADGAGSHRLSRVGSNLAVNTAIATMKAKAEKYPGTSEYDAQGFVKDGLNAAWVALRDKAGEKPGVMTFADLSTTLLLLAYHPKNGWLAIAQVGDGLIAALRADGSFEALANPESGGYSGETYFLTSYTLEQLPSKVHNLGPATATEMLFVMTDGVSDDLYPPSEKSVALLSGAMRGFVAKPRGEEARSALFDYIGYERPGSFDDRTFVVLCRQQTPPTQAATTAQLAANVQTPAPQSLTASLPPPKRPGEFDKQESDPRVATTRSGGSPSAEGHAVVVTPERGSAEPNEPPQSVVLQEPSGRQDAPSNADGDSAQAAPASPEPPNG